MIDGNPCNTCEACKGILDESMIVKTIKLSNIKERQHYLNKFDDEREDIIA